ncbi:LysM peptidoglycan-binding domain-containing protein [Paenibacillus glycanilyticus]|uniref:LysM peptidoglycan-binding domain-containing protein n=1 Tax=Paenibacillus glycanilyticus TaxID=126569 RepID=UPI002041CC4A|nr:LysM peptidoglycan-binding domain-containing protein [Paenibacillus glycanilyticus]MCM3630817.1 LysM peptidoglycan-binding domain-containing protein [Paenibacillus glycanilyticus]
MIMIMMVVVSYPGSLGAAADKTPGMTVSYTIQPGDTLFGISKKYYLTGRFEQVAKANGLNPQAGLKAGTVIKLKNPLVLDYYEVRQGDTLFAITKHYFNRGNYMDALMTYNGISDPDTPLKIGMTLRVPLPSGEGRHHVVKGDTLYSLSVRYFKPQDYQKALAQTNGINTASGRIQAGQELQIPNPYYMARSESTASAAAPAKLSIDIDITRNKLYVKAGGAIKKTFDIASGRKAGLTPTGSFEIMTKIENPWYSAKGIPGGDPKNPLGSRWLGLSVPNTQGTKYGIHGTNAPASIGTNASAGCIRMLNEDVEWLYDAVPNGTKVRIHT